VEAGAAAMEASRYLAARDVSRKQRAVSGKQ
jgi:hypothetical protein